MSGGSEERFPPQRAVIGPTAGGEVLVSVVADVNLTRRQGSIRFVNPLPAGRASDPAPGSEVALRALDGSGRQIREAVPVPVGLASELEPGDDREGMVHTVLPLTSETRAIELLVGGEIASRVRVGGTLPALRDVHRLDDDDPRALRVGLALDGELEEHHTYAAQVSNDQGRTWQTVGVGLTEPVFAFDRSQLSPGDEVQVRVLATNGLASAVVSTGTLRV